MNDDFRQVAVFGISFASDLLDGGRVVADGPKAKVVAALQSGQVIDLAGADLGRIALEGGEISIPARARIGGIKGTLGLAEDRAEASIACRQVGPISIPEPLKKQEEVFSERMSILFKRLRIVRMVDAPRNTLVYLTYSEKLIDGSPQNSLTAVPVDRATAIPVRK